MIYQNASASTPITGTATACTGLGACTYAITDTSGSGWATTSTAFGSVISFQLPGELLATRYQPYSVHTVSISASVYTEAGTFTVTDADTGKIVSGTTSTTITATEHCSRTGCYYTYALVSGTITFNVTNVDGTVTVVACNPSSFNSGGSTKCTATVTDQANHSKFPTGTVTFSISPYYYGTFSNKGKCTLSSGSCSVQFTPSDNSVGNIPIYAVYKGNTVFHTSSGSTVVSVTGD
jgi:hypothetical protein